VNSISKRAISLSASSIQICPLILGRYLVSIALPGL
jgi:hypothetical protein